MNISKLNYVRKDHKKSVDMVPVNTVLRNKDLVNIIDEYIPCDYFYTNIFDLPSHLLADVCSHRSYKGIDGTHIEELVDRASKCGRVDILKVLRSKFKAILWEDTMEQAVRHNQLDVVKYLHSCGVKFQETFLVSASTDGFLGIFMYIISFMLNKCLFDCMSDCLTECIESASLHGHLDIVEFIFNLGDVNTRYSIHAAMFNEHNNIVEYLRTHDNDSRLVIDS